IASSRRLPPPTTNASAKLAGLLSRRITTPNHAPGQVNHDPSLMQRSREGRDLLIRARDVEG
ncbi:MAG TPA: hypothetical protein VKQ73_11375, partial [Stellaceae bacterium]|nr:hypothetical protein [Stellaceae bacterium]